jgi:hypothetical protein
MAPALTLFVVPSGFPLSPYQAAVGKLLDLTVQKKNAS